MLDDLGATAFIPRIFRRCNSTADKFLLKPSSHTIDGAVLLADISGFSKFAAEICKKGQRGLETLHSVTNGFLGHFVETVHKNNGDVISFAGDALICLFPADVSLLAEAVVNAVSCAWELHAFKDSAHGLSAHFAISCGRVHLAVVGGVEDEWIYMMNGLCIDELHDLIEMAKSQEVVCSKECLPYAKAFPVKERAGSLSRSFSTAFNNFLRSNSRIPNSQDSPSHAVNHSPSSKRGSTTSDSHEMTLDKHFDQAEVLEDQSPHDFANRGGERRKAGVSVRTSDVSDKSVTCGVHGAQRKATVNRRGTDTSDKSSVGSVHGAHALASRAGRRQSQISSVSRRIIEDKSSVRSVDSTHSGGSRRNSDVHGRIGSNSRRQTELHVDVSIDDLEAFMYIPRTVVSHNGEIDIAAAELRKVATIFLSLDSYSPSEHENPLSLQPVALVLQELLKELGGFLRQFLVDDKGCVAIAIWGVRFFSHSNNCSRALLFANKVVSRLDDINHRCSIGLTVGEAYCGIIGSRTRCDYACIGSKINLAARLMGKAGGKVLVDPDVHPQLTEEEKKTLVLHQPLLLKGMSAMLTPYRFVDHVDESAPEQVLADAESGVGNVVRREVASEILDLFRKISSVQVPRDCSHSLGSGQDQHFQLSMVGKIDEKPADSLSQQADGSPLMSGDAVMVAVVSASPSPRSQSSDGQKPLPPSIRKLFTQVSSFMGSSASVHPVALSSDESNTQLKETSWVSQGNAARRSSWRKSITKMLSFTSESGNVRGELNAENASLKTLKTQCLPVLIMAGPPGSGKYTATQFVIKMANRLNVECFTVECPPEDEIMPFSTAVSMLDEMIMGIGENMSFPVVKTNSNPRVGHDTVRRRSAGPSKHELRVTQLVDGARERLEQNGTFIPPPLYSYLEERLLKIDEYDDDDDEMHASQQALSKLFTLANMFSGYILLLAQVVSECVHIVSSYRQGVVVIRHAEYCDKSSWEVLNYIQCNPGPSLTRIGFVITAAGYAMESQSQGLILTEDTKVKEKEYSTDTDLCFSSTMAEYEAVVENDKKSKRRPSRRISGSALLSNRIASSRVSTTRLKTISEHSERTTGAPGEACYARLLKNQDTHIIAMTTDMTREEVGEIFRQVTGVDVPDGLLSQVLKITSGHGFWVKALASFFQHKSSSSDLTADNSDALLPSFSMLENDNPLATLILSKLDLLSSDDATILKYASVVGDEFTEQMLRELLPAYLKATLSSALTYFSIEHFLNQVMEKPISVYKFNNKLIQSVVYATIPPSERSAIHRLAVQYIEREYGDAIEPFAITLSYHYARIEGESEKAFTFAVRAAQVATGAEKLRTSLLLLQRAAAVSDCSATQMSTLQGIAHDNIQLILSMDRPSDKKYEIRQLVLDFKKFKADIAGMSGEQAPGIFSIPLLAETAPIESFRASFTVNTLRWAVDPSSGKGEAAGKVRSFDVGLFLFLANFGWLLYGWNHTLVYGVGYWAVCVALFIFAYVVLLNSVAELTAAAPLNGGSYGRTRVFLGFYWAALVGGFQWLQALVRSGVFIAESASIICDYMQCEKKWSLPICFIFYFFTVVMCILKGRWIFNLNIIVGLFGFVVLISVVVAGCLYSSLPEYGPYDTDKTAFLSYTSSSSSSSQSKQNRWFAEGPSAFMHCFAYAWWPFEGVQGTMFLTSLAETPQKTMSQGLTAGIYALVLAACVVMLVACSLPPGLSATASAVFPLNAGFVKLFGEYDERAVSVAFGVPFTITSSLLSFLSATLLLFAMADSSMLPSVFVSTEYGFNLCLLVNTVLCTLIFLVSYFSISIYGHTGDFAEPIYLGDIMISTVALGGLFASIADLIGFIRLRLQFYHLRTGFKSRFGVPGAVAAICVYAVGIIAIAGYSQDNYAAVLTFLVVSGVLSIYYYFYCETAQTLSGNELSNTFRLHMDLRNRSYSSSKLVGGRSYSSSKLLS